MFQGEQLIYGNIGHILVLLSFISSIVAAIAYFKSSFNLNEPNTAWLKLGKSAFVIHVASLFGVFATLFYLIFNHRYEYHYVWAHSNNQLPFKYLLSCFWEGQEGSFLLWLTWHGVLGLVVLFNAKKWEGPVMTVISAVQIILSAFIIGVYFGNVQIGSSPFLLLRHQMQGAPIFQQPDYLKLITDGKGLNPLLQNYWMVTSASIVYGFCIYINSICLCYCRFMEKKLYRLG
jgi:cytochrome c-type biogenesis protein CcmF